MRVAEVSTFSQFSVGKIMCDIRDGLKSTGHECVVCFSRGKDNGDYKIGNLFLTYVNAISARLFDNDGFCTKSGTKKLIEFLKEYKPDIIHLHCLHGYYLNSKILFDYIKKYNIKTIWTMHDTWAITGHCTYFDLYNCSKWKKECSNCKAKKDFPKTFFDKSTRNFKLKKSVFTSVDENNMFIVSPSKWLDNIIEESYLNKYKHYIIYNGVDNSLFFDKNYNREKIALSVANVWDKRKNIDEILELSHNLKNWKIVIVGKLNKKIEKNSYKNITFINHLNSIELKELYNKASIFLNPTLSDNFPTVNIEAQLCGLIVLTHDIGGNIETNIGKLKLIEDFKALCDNELDNIYNNLNCKKIDCNILSKETMIENYLKLYYKVYG